MYRVPTLNAWSLNQSLTTVGKLERENATLVKVQLVLVRFGVVEHLHIAAFHADSQPLACRTVAQREDLRLGEQTQVKHYCFALKSVWNENSPFVFLMHVYISYCEQFIHVYKLWNWYIDLWCSILECNGQILNSSQPSMHLTKPLHFLFNNLITQKKKRSVATSTA